MWKTNRTSTQMNGATSGCLLLGGAVVCRYASRRQCVNAALSAQHPWRSAGRFYPQRQRLLISWIIAPTSLV
uniref:Conotoxin n=1 Tax=Conus betulinus TaxID=89764 RepID=A0A1P7ZCS1_CONBE|nr:Conotoxin [Conus betulinus]